MTTEAKHTPTPTFETLAAWISPSNGDVYLVDEKQLAIALMTKGCRLTEFNDENAAHIVRCVNAHERLVALANDVIAASEVSGLPDCDPAHELRSLACAARAALADLEGK